MAAVGSSGILIVSFMLLQNMKSMDPFLFSTSSKCANILFKRKKRLGDIIMLRQTYIKTSVGQWLIEASTLGV